MEHQLEFLFETECSLSMPSIGWARYWHQNPLAERGARPQRLTLVAPDDRVNAMAPDRRVSLIEEFERNVAALVA